MRDLKELLDSLESDVSLYDPPRLRDRIEALDRLDAFNLEAAPPYATAAKMQAKLEAANSRVFELIRDEIRAGHGASMLSDWLIALRGEESSAPIGEGYDYLDEFVAGILQFSDAGVSAIEPSAEMIFYQPTPARHIFDLLRRAALTQEDVLIDLGSGLGHVPLLTSVCTSARAIGIELEPAYTEIARQSAQSLSLATAEFIQQDAREADLNKGTLFYLFTPFRGAMMRTMLDLLRDQTTRRQIRLCTFGPCTTTVAREEWLEALGAPQVDQLSIFRSKRF